MDNEPRAARDNERFPCGFFRLWLDEYLSEYPKFGDSVLNIWTVCVCTVYTSHLKLTLVMYFPRNQRHAATTIDTTELTPW